MKKRRPTIIKDKKLRGEWAEMQFMARAAEHGLPVCKPWGEMNSFDFVVGSPRRFASVQVKSTAFQVGTGYDCTVRGGHAAYRAGSFDFLAAYLVPVDVWYIVPAQEIRGLGNITFYPDSSTSKYEQYREAWHLLRQAAQLSEEKLTEGPASPQEPTASAEPPPTDVGAIHPAGAFDRMQAVMNTFRYRLENPNGFAKKEDQDR